MNLHAVGAPEPSCPHWTSGTRQESQQEKWGGLKRKDWTWGEEQETGRLKKRVDPAAIVDIGSYLLASNLLTPFLSLDVH